MRKNRRQPKIQERLTKCQCCGYPISQRHHLLEISGYGESQYTRQLCANCHELYHVIQNARMDFRKSENTNTRNVILIIEILNVWGQDDPRIKYIVDLIDLVEQGKKEIRERQITAKIIEGFFNG